MAFQDHEVCTVLAHWTLSYSSKLRYIEVSQLFNALQQRFHKKKPSYFMNTYMRLLRFKMKSNTRIQDYIHAFENLFSELQNMREQLTDMKESMYLLNSLQSIYQMILKILLHRQNTTFTYNEVVSALLTNTIQYDMLSPSLPSTSRTLLIVTQDLSHPRYNNNSRRTRLKRQSSISKAKEPLVNVSII